MKKTYASKWALIGVSIKERLKIYQRLRLRTKEILRQRYKKEYEIILDKLMEKEFSRLKKIIKK